MLTTTENHNTPMIELTDESREAVIGHLKDVIAELEDPTRTILDAKFQHGNVYNLVIRLEKPTRPPVLEVLDQMHRDNAAAVLEAQAQRLRRSHDVPMDIEMNQKRPLRYIKGVPCHSADEEFECRIVLFRRANTPVMQAKEDNNDST